MRDSAKIVRISAALVALVVVAAALLWADGRAQAAVTVGGAIAPPPQVARANAPVAQATDPRIIEVEPIQAIAHEPLILRKSTVVRVLIGSVATTTAPISISATLDFDGQQLAQTATLTQTEQYVDFYPAAPTVLRTITISAAITPGAGVADADPGNNSKEISVPTIKMPADTVVKIFYLPVDWDGAAREVNEFDTYFPAYVKENTDFVRATYPMPDDQVIAESTDVPHILTPAERELADRHYNMDSQSFLRFGGSVVLTARQYAPDAELIAAVLPPHWLQEHYSRAALGFASSAFPGVTFVLLWGPRTIVIGHEYGHLRNLIDDYDFGGSRSVTGYYVDRPGFWVAHKQPVDATPGYEVFNMMGSAAYNGDYNHFWIDSRSYEHLIANYISTGGAASAPLVLAATVTDPQRVTAGGAPLFAAAGQNYWEPSTTIGLSVATIGTQKSDKLKVVWKRAGQIVDQKEVASPGPQFAYTMFTLKGKGKDGLALGRYDAEIYLNGVLTKTARFFVEPNWTPAFNITLGDNAPDGSAGYRAALGVSTADKQQAGMFVDFVSAKQPSIYAWFVARADGLTPPQDMNVQLKFIGPDGKEYPGKIIDRDGKLTAGQTLGSASYVRAQLNVTGTDAAGQLGDWSVQAWLNGKQVAAKTFSLLSDSAGSATAAADSLLDALGYRLIRIQTAANSADAGGSLVVLNVEAISEDMKSGEFIRELWDGFKVAETLYPNYDTYRLKIPVNERHSVYFDLKRADWDAIAQDEPSWDVLRDQPSFALRVRDDLQAVFLSDEDAVSFLEERIK